MAVLPQKKLEFWYPTIQGLVGKLYVLSLFYIVYDFLFANLRNDANSHVESSNDDAPPQEPTSAFVPTLTVPFEAYDTFSLDTRVDGGLTACSQYTVPPTPAMSADTAV